MQERWDSLDIVPKDFPKDTYVQNYYCNPMKVYCMYKKFLYYDQKLEDFLDIMYVLIGTNNRPGYNLLVHCKVILGLFC